MPRKLCVKTKTGSRISTNVFVSPFNVDKIRRCVVGAERVEMFTCNTSTGDLEVHEKFSENIQERVNMFIDTVDSIKAL